MIAARAANDPCLGLLYGAGCAGVKQRNRHKGKDGGRKPEGRSAPALA